MLLGTGVRESSPERSVSATEIITALEQSYDLKQVLVVQKVTGGFEVVVSSLAAYHSLLLTQRLRATTKRKGLLQKFGTTELTFISASPILCQARLSSIPFLILSNPRRLDQLLAICGTVVKYEMEYHKRDGWDVPTGSIRVLFSSVSLFFALFPYLPGTGIETEFINTLADFHSIIAGSPEEQQLFFHVTPRMEVFSSTSSHPLGEKVKKSKFLISHSSKASRQSPSRPPKQKHHNSSGSGMNSTSSSHLMPSSASKEKLPAHSNDTSLSRSSSSYGFV